MGDQREAVIKVTGMTCDDCAHHVTAALRTAGAKEVSVHWSDGEAKFNWPEAVSENTLRSAVCEAGYGTGQLQVQGQRTPVSPGSENDYDLLVIGAGSAAFAVAIRASEAGYKVGLVESCEIGGTCVNVGCVPSKALLRAGEAAWSVEHNPFGGISASLDSVDLSKVVTQKQELVRSLRQTKYADLAGEYGFSVLHGHARFIGKDAIEVDGKPLTASRILIATGASPSVPPIPGLKENGFLTSTTTLELTEIPSRLVVIGANAIGVELGQYFLHLGSEVTFIDVADRIVPFEEPEISSALAEVLSSQGAAIYTGATVSEVSAGNGGRIVRLKQNGAAKEILVDQILVATGRRPNTSDLGLELAGVETDARGAVIVDDRLRTANEKVYAAGDVAGAPQFVYVSAYQGALAVDNALLGADRIVDFTALPRVIFSSPQVASAGITQAQAVAAGYDIVTSVLPLDAIPRALVNHDTNGLFKLVAESGSGKLLGASIMAESAGEVIQSAVLAIKYGIPVSELASTFHPYLTMAEGLKLAAQTFTRDVHKLSCCAV
ncbi:MAG: mercury(II) reductase [Actinomycetota bacterium]|nr:MAG: mercury(II) reductase [Actinomycetota bacterium]